MKKKTHCWDNSKIKFTRTEKVWRVGSGRKNKYCVAATIKCAYPFPNSNINMVWVGFFCVLTPLSAISWRPVLVVEEAGENHRPWASNW